MFRTHSEPGIDIRTCRRVWWRGLKKVDVCLVFALRQTSLEGARSSVVEHPTFNRTVESSNLSGRTI